MNHRSKWIDAREIAIIRQLQLQRAISAARQTPNIYIETCSSWRQFGSIEELVEGAGEDRILFGSDQPLMDPRVQIGRYLTSDLSETAKRKALGENAARLLGIKL